MRKKGKDPKGSTYNRPRKYVKGPTLPSAQKWEKSSWVEEGAVSISRTVYNTQGKKSTPPRRGGGKRKREEPAGEGGA